MIKYDVEYKKFGTSTWKVIKDVIRVGGIPKTIDMTAPKVTLGLHSRNGRYSTKFKRSDEFRIYRAQELWFHGKVMDQTRQVSDKVLEVTLTEKSYAKQQEVICMDAYRQLGYTAWKWGASTQNPGENAQGIRPDQMIKAAIGTHYYVQTFFETQAIFSVLENCAVESQLVTITKAAGEMYNPDGTFITNTLVNTLGGFSVMPPIRGVESIILSGDQPGDATIDVYVSRDNGATYFLVTPTFDSGSGLWVVGPISDGDFGGTPDNQLVLKVVLHSTSDNTLSPFIRSVLIDTLIANDDGSGDTGLFEGTIDVYDDPELDDDTIGADMSRRYRSDVLEAAVKGSVSNQDDEYPIWFGFIDEKGYAHYRDPSTYGADLSGTVILSRDLGTLSDLKVTLEGNVINNLVYIGQGLPPYGEITLTSNDFGGLKDTDSIAKFGEIQGTVQEKGIPSISYALKRARIVLKNKKQPALILEATPLPEFKLKGDIGDYVRVRDIQHDVDARVRIMSREFSWDSSSGEEDVTVVLSNNKFTLKAFLGQVARQQESQNMIGQGSSSPPSLSFVDNIDIDHPAELSFWLPRGVRIKAVKCYAQSQKFRAYERGLAAGGSSSIGTGSSGTEPVFTMDGSGRTFTISSGGLGTDTQTGFTAEDLSDIETLRVTVGLSGRSSVVPYDDVAEVAIIIYTSTTAGGTPVASYTGIHQTPVPDNGSGAPRVYDFDVNIAELSGTPNFLRGYIIDVFHDGTSSFSGATWDYAVAIIGLQKHTHAVEIPSHIHDVEYGIFEYGYYPAGVQLYVKDYPTTGDNPNAGSLGDVFPSFGTRGTEDAAFEVESLEISAAFRDSEGAFQTGILHKMWLLPQSSDNNAEGLGRITVHVFIELVEGVDPN